MNILVISRCRTDNFGDQAIGIAMQKLIESGNPSNIVFLEDLKNSHIAGHDSKPLVYIKKIISRIGFADVLWKIENRSLFGILGQRKFDVIFIGGGELVQSNRIFPLALDEWTKHIKIKQAQTPIFLFGVGVTKSYSPKDKKRVEKALSRIDGFVVRDNTSQKNLKDLFGLESMVIPDVVYSLTFEDSGYKRNCVLYGITNFERIRKYGIYAKSREDYFNKSIYEIEKLGGARLFFTTRSDREECMRIKEYAQKEKGLILSIVECKDLDGLLIEMQKACDVYSPRMHGCILADLCGARSHPIIISPKMKSYHDTYVHPLDFESLKEKVLKVMDSILKNINKN